MSRLIFVLEWIFMGIAVLCMTGIMLTVSFDALGRYAFNSPLPWSYELVTFYLMVTVVYFAASSTFRNDDHIGVDLLYHLMGRRLRAAAGIFSCLAAVAVFAIVTYGGWKATAGYYSSSDFIPGYIMWPTWLSYLPIPLGVGLLVLRMLHHAWMLARYGEDPNVLDRLDGISTERGE